jgi:hypothetical protein
MYNDLLILEKNNFKRCMWLDSTTAWGINLSIDNFTNINSKRFTYRNYFCLEDGVPFSPNTSLILMLGTARSKGQFQQL